MRAARAQLLALLGRDHVVRRRDERLERPRHRLVVAEGAEGLDDGHRSEPTNGPRLRLVSTIAELTADRTVEGVYAVARKQRRTTRKGAPYLLLELVDPTGRIEARIWKDVELLDGRFAEGDAVRVLGRVESFDNRLQLEIRSVEAADDDPAGLAPRMRRDADELDGFLEFLAGRALASRAGWRVVRTVPRRRGDPEGAARAAGRRDASLLRGRPARAHGRRRDARARDRAAPPAAALPTCCSRRRCCTTSGASASWVAARRSGRPRRAACSAMSISACGSSRSGPTALDRGRARRASARDRLATTTATPRGRPRRPCSTTPTSSTPSRRPDPSASARDRAGTRREPLVGARRLRRRPEVEDAARPDGAGAVAGRRAWRRRWRGSSLRATASRAGPRRRGGGRRGVRLPRASGRSIAGWRSARWASSRRSPPSPP